MRTHMSKQISRLRYDMYFDTPCLFYLYMTLVTVFGLTHTVLACSDSHMLENRPSVAVRLHGTVTAMLDHLSFRIKAFREANATSVLF